MSSTHVILHLITISVAIILLIISTAGFLRKRNAKMLFICAGFATFAVKAMLLFINISFYQSAELEIASHILDLAILMLFFIGIWK